MDNVQEYNICRNIPGIHFWFGLSQPRGHSVAELIRSIEKYNDLIRIRTCDLPACSRVVLGYTFSLRFFATSLSPFGLYLDIDSIRHSTLRNIGSDHRYHHW
jgi:hypothetical protein